MKNYLYLFLFLLSTQFLSAQKEAAFEAVRQGDLAKLQTLLKEDPTLLQAQNARGHNLLILAAYYEQADILAQLIKAGGQFGPSRCLWQYRLDGRLFQRLRPSPAATD